MSVSDLVRGVEAKIKDLQAVDRELRLEEERRSLLDSQLRQVEASIRASDLVLQHNRGRIAVIEEEIVRMFAVNSGKIPHIRDISDVDPGAPTCLACLVAK